MGGQGFEDVVPMMAGLAAQLRVELGFYKLTEQTGVFLNIWGVRDVLCSVREHTDPEFLICLCVSVLVFFVCVL